MPTSSSPTYSPSLHPTNLPTHIPSRYPTFSRPTLFPTTTRPTFDPTNFPTTPMPTRIPSVIPTKVPTTSKPTRVPSVIPTKFPTRTPTKFPTSSRPTLFPSTSHPTFYPTSSRPTFYPSSSRPTNFPSVSHPTRGPSTSHPTFYPSSSNPTRAPSVSPSINPSLNATLHMHNHDADMLMGLPMEYVQYAFCGMVAFPCILIICFCCRNSGGKKSEKSLLEDIKMENGYDFNSIAVVDPSWHAAAEFDHSPPRGRVDSFRAKSPVLEPPAKQYYPPDNFDRHNTSPYTSRSDRSDGFDRHTSPYMNRSAQDRHTSPYMHRSTREGTITTQFGDFFEGYEYTDDDSESTSLVMYGAHLYGHKRDISTASSIISNPRQTHITSNPEFYVPVGRKPPSLSSVMYRVENRTVPPPPPPPEIPPFKRSFTPVEPPEETATCLPLYSPNDQESMLIEEEGHYFRASIGGANCESPSYSASIKFSPSLGDGILEP